MNLTRSVVIHIGSHQTVVGYNDSETPTCILPSSYIKNKSTNEYIFDYYEMLSVRDELNLDQIKNDIEVFTLLNENGLPYNWEMIERQWDYIFQEKLLIDISQYPLVINLPILNNMDTIKFIMEKYMELCFHKFNIPMLQFIMEPLSMTLSCGKKNGIVVKMDMNGCSVIPIIDGNVIKNGIISNKFGIEFLNYIILNKINALTENSSDNDEEKKINDANDAQNLSSYEMWYNNETWVQELRTQYLGISDRDLNETKRFYDEQTEMYIRQQEQYAQLNNTKINRDLLISNYQANNNPLEINKNFLLKQINDKPKTIRMKQKDIFALTEPIFQPKLFNDKFHNTDGLIDIIDKSLKKTVNIINSQGINKQTSINTVGATILLPLQKTKNANEKRDNDTDDLLNDSSIMLNSNGVNNSSGANSIPEHIYNSLLNNIIIIGDGILIDGLETRIHKELTIRYPQYKVNNVAMTIPLKRTLNGWYSMCTMSQMPNWELGHWYLPRDLQTAPISQ